MTVKLIINAQISDRFAICLTIKLTTHIAQDLFFTYHFLHTVNHINKK